LIVTDHEFLTAFEDGSLAAEAFDHSAHIRAAFLYLSRHAFLEACVAMRDSLRRFAARAGNGNLYHETITVAFMSIVSGRMERSPEFGWEALLAAHPELCDRGLLSRYYRPETLASPVARQRFVLSEMPTGDLREITHG
jgi:hypothetical protein